MSNYHHNTSLISSRTRSRSVSVSSTNSSVCEDIQMEDPIESISAVRNDFVDITNMTTALAKSLEVVGTTASLDAIKTEVRKIRADITRIDNKFDTLFQMFENLSSQLRVASVQQVSSQAEVSIVPVETVGNDLFSPEGNLFNELSVSLTSI